MSEELTTTVIISSIIGMVITIIQFSIPNLKDNLLSLTKDFILGISTTTPGWFNFAAVSLINIAIMSGIIYTLMTVIK